MPRSPERRARSARDDLRMQLRQIARLDEWYGLDARAAVHHGAPGAGAIAAGAESSRSSRGPAHGGVRFRLSRLAARWARSGAVARREVSRPRADPLPAGLERGPGRHGDLGRPADEPVRRRALRRRVLDVVRQGSRRRSFRRPAEARQRGRHLEVRRRARRGGRRPHLQIVLAAASERVRIHRCDDSGARAGRRAGDRRARPVRLRVVAVQWLLGRR